MKNKVLIELYIVETDNHYNLYIPVNEYVGKVIKLIVASAFELDDVEHLDKEYYLINPDNGEVYDNHLLIRDSNIKNAKVVYLV